MNNHRYYQEYEGEKCCYRTYWGRIQDGQPKKKAILPAKNGRPKKDNEAIKELKRFYKKYKTLPTPSVFSRVYNHNRRIAYSMFMDLKEKGILGVIDKQYTVKDLSFFE